MKPSIRPFTPDDYEVLAKMMNAVAPEYARTAEEIRSHDERRDPKCRHQRFLAEANEAGTCVVVGAGGYGQSAWSYHPQHFGLGLDVRPEFHGHGVGKALFNTVMEALVPFDPLRINTHTREDRPRSLRFLDDRGFVENMREWESRLDVRAFDAAPFAGAEERVRAENIVLRTLAELADDPDRDRKLHALESELDVDVPSPDPPTPLSFEQWTRTVVESPNLLSDAFFVAVHEPSNAYVGLSALWRRQADNDLDTGLTGVTRPSRRKGIALALKLRAVAYAQAHGHPVIRTENEQNNRGMLGINERLGFVKQPAWISFAKTIKEAAP